MTVVGSQGPAVRIRVPYGYVDGDTRKKLTSVVHSKLGVVGLQETWSMVGKRARVTYTIREQPPAKVTLADIAPYADGCREHQFVLGLAAGARPVIVDLDDDSPHIACSSATGGGKTVLAMITGSQVLRGGGHVLILDRKGSHRWARGLDGVTYLTEIPDIHDALIGIQSLAEARNRQAREEREDWDPGARVLVIFEELDSTISALKGHWGREVARLRHENKRLKDQGYEEEYIPPLSPAIRAFRDLMNMGRSAHVNLFGVAQMLTVAACGSTEARENFGVRCLARYTNNAWKMLVPQCRMPPKSVVRGRWQVVVGDQVTETQVPFPEQSRGVLDVEAVREFAMGGVRPSTKPPMVGRRDSPVGEPVVVERVYTAAEASRELFDMALTTITTAKSRAKQRTGVEWPRQMTEAQWRQALNRVDAG
jgi:hypothetical protein